MNRYGFRFMAGVIFCILASSCRYEELCYDHSGHALRNTGEFRFIYEEEWEYPYGGFPDWEWNWKKEFGYAYDALRPDVPEGIRVCVYHGGLLDKRENIPSCGGKIQMGPEQSLLMYNNDTEYIVFNDIETYATATATTRTKTRVSYFGNSLIPSSREETTMTPPDNLWCFYTDYFYCPETTENDVRSVEVLMKPLVFKYLIRWKFESGIEYAALARGALSGMAGAVRLNDGHTLDEPATILFDCEIKDWGVEACITSFGVPGFPNSNYLTKGSGLYGLNLEVKLRNGLLKKFNLDVTGMVERQPHGGVIEVSGLRIDREDGEKGGGGFDVDIDDWGEIEDVEIPIR